MNSWQCISKLFIPLFNMFTLFEFQTICTFWFCFVLFRFFSPERPRRADYREIVSATLKNCILLLLL